MLLQLLEVFAEPEPAEQVGLSRAPRFGTGGIHGAARRESLRDAGLCGPSPLPEAAGEGTVGISLCSWQELNSEMKQHQEDLATLEHLAAELGSSGFAPGASQQQEKLQSLKKDFLQLQKVAKER